MINTGSIDDAAILQSCHGLITRQQEHSMFAGRAHAPIHWHIYLLLNGIPEAML